MPPPRYLLAKSIAIPFRECYSIVSVSFRVTVERGDVFDNQYYMSRDLYSVEERDNRVKRRNRDEREAAGSSYNYEK